MPLAAILALIQAGTAITGQFVSGTKSQSWINLGQRVAAGGARAVQARDTIERWAAAGYSPSAEELDAVLAESEALHSEIQRS